MLAGLARLVLLALGGAAVWAALTARAEARRRGTGLRAVVPGLPGTLRRELAGIADDARSALADGRVAAAERRHELRQEVAGARRAGA